MIFLFFKKTGGIFGRGGVYIGARGESREAVCYLSTMRTFPGLFYCPFSLLFYSFFSRGRDVFAMKKKRKEKAEERMVGERERNFIIPFSPSPLFLSFSLSLFLHCVSQETPPSLSRSSSSL